MRIRKLAKELATDDRSVIALLHQLGHTRYNDGEQQLTAEVEGQIRRNARALPRAAVVSVAAPRPQRVLDPEAAALARALGGVRPLGPDAPRPRGAAPEPKVVVHEPDPVEEADPAELARFQKEMARVTPLGAKAPAKPAAKPAPIPVRVARGADLPSRGGGRQADPAADAAALAELAAMGVAPLGGGRGAGGGAPARPSIATGATRPSVANTAVGAPGVATVPERAAATPAPDVDASALLAALGATPLGARGGASAASAPARSAGASGGPGVGAGSARAGAPARPSASPSVASVPARAATPNVASAPARTGAASPLPGPRAPSSFNPPARERGWVDPRVELAEARAIDAEQRLLDAEARLALAEARVRVVEEHLALADGETAAAHARAVAEEERADALAAQLATGPGALRVCLEQRGLRGEEEQTAALRALLDGRRYHELDRLELAHPSAAFALLWERVVLVAEDEPVPAGTVAVRVPADRSEGQRSPAVRAALSRLSTACLVSGTKRIGIAGGPPALHRLLRDGLDSRIELQQWPGDIAARGLPSQLPSVLVLWATDVPASRHPGAIVCAEPNLVALALRVAESLDAK